MFVYIVEGSPKCLVNIYRYTTRVSFLASQKSFPSFLLGSSPGRLAAWSSSQGRRHLNVPREEPGSPGPRGQPVGTVLQDIRGASAPISTYRSTRLVSFIYTIQYLILQIDTEVAE